MKLRIKVKAGTGKYFRENLGAPFIIGFMALLIICAGLLVQGNSSLANDAAVYAYYLLIIGVFLQLASSLKYREREENE
jgi:hypothetical protein